MTSAKLLYKLRELMPAPNGKTFTAKELMEISKAFNYFMAEQIQIAPCDHVGEFHYETISGRYCGVCQRKMEVANERRDSETAA